MSDWTPMTRQDPDVRGVDPQASGLLRITVGLSKTPPVAWAEHFLRPSNVSISMGMHPPTISGATITIRAPDPEVEKYIANVDERIAAANRMFETMDLPKIRAQEEGKRQQAEDEQRRIREARDRLKRPE